MWTLFIDAECIFKPLKRGHHVNLEIFEVPMVSGLESFHCINIVPIVHVLYELLQNIYAYQQSTVTHYIQLLS